MTEQATISNKTDKRVYTGIDLFKLIASVMVIILHCLGTTLGEPGKMFMRNVCSLAIPFFFIASGFFFTMGLQKAEDKWQYFVKYEKKLLTLYAIWTLISLPISLYEYYQRFGENLIRYFLVMVRKIFFVGSFGVYWYLLTLILTVVLIYFFTVKIKKVRLMYVLAGLFFLYNIIYTGFQPLFSDIPLFAFSFKAIHFVFSWEKNFFMTGLIYVSIGYFLATHKIKINLLWSWIGLIVSIALKYSESYFAVIEEALTGKATIFAENQLQLFQLFAAIFYFLVAYNLKLPKLKPYSLSMRQLSSAYYFTHFVFLYFVDFDQQKNGLMDIAIILVLCTAFYFIIKKINNKKLNILING